jgi:hypothetical protein
VQHQAKLIDQEVALLAFGQLAGIEATRVGSAPPFLRSSRSGCRRCRGSGWPRAQPARGISRTGSDGSRASVPAHRQK